jgi:NADH-quinone oxidoreductase subunit L
VQEHLHRPDRSEPWIWMAAAVTVLSVLSVVGGWVQIPGVWNPFTQFLEPTVTSVVEPSGAQEWLASICAVTLGVVGIAVAWATFSARTLRIPEMRGVRTVLEHKFYFDELYDALFYRPTVLLAVTLRDWIERPVILASLGGIGTAARKASSELREVQTGLVRTYALAIAGSVTVLAFVFVWVK